MIIKLLDPGLEQEYLSHLTFSVGSSLQQPSQNGVVIWDVICLTPVPQLEDAAKSYCLSLDKVNKVEDEGKMKPLR